MSAGMTAAARRDAPAGDPVFDDRKRGNFPELLLAVAFLVVAFVPSAALHSVALAAFYAVLFTFFINDPPRCLFATILGLPIIFVVPMFPLVRGINSETIVILTLGMMALLVRGQQPRPSPGNPFVPPLVVTCGIFAISLLISYTTGSAQLHDPFQGWYALSLGDMIAPLKNSMFIVFLAPIAFRVIWKPEHLRRALLYVSFVMVGLSAQALYVMWEFLVAGQLGGFNRANGLVNSEPNSFGGLLSLGICLSLPAFLDGETSRRDRLVLLASMGLSSVALMLTLSRGSWMALLAALLYIALFRGAKAATFLLVLGLTAGYWLPENVTERVQQTVYETDQPFQEDDLNVDRSAKLRIERWQSLPGQWLDAPLFGHGYMSYPRVWGRLGKAGEARGAHSTYISLIVEQGAAGIVIYFWIWLTVFFGTRRGRRSAVPLVRSLSSGFTAALICLLILDITASRMFDPTVMMYFWVLAGGLTRVALEESRDEWSRYLLTRQPRPRQPVRPDPRDTDPGVEPRAYPMRKPAPGHPPGHPSSPGDGVGRRGS